MRLIDADDLKIVNNTPDWKVIVSSPKDLAKVVQEWIDSAPTVEAEPVRHGHWIDIEYGWACSECGHYTETTYREMVKRGWVAMRPYYCGYCGAKMDEEAEE